MNPIKRRTSNRVITDFHSNRPKRTYFRPKRTFISYAYVCQQCQGPYFYLCLLLFRFCWLLYWWAITETRLHSEVARKNIDNPGAWSLMPCMQQNANHCFTWFKAANFHVLLICFLKVRWNYSRLLIFKGVRELKVRQIGHSNIFSWWFVPIMAISCVIIYF